MLDHLLPAGYVCTRFALCFRWLLMHAHEMFACYLCLGQVSQALLAACQAHPEPGLHPNALVVALVHGKCICLVSPLALALSDVPSVTENEAQHNGYTTSSNAQCIAAHCQNM
jgi:hypothetical protein